MCAFACVCVFAYVYVKLYRSLFFIEHDVFFRNKREIGRQKIDVSYPQKVPDSYVSHGTNQNLLYISDVIP